MTALGVLRATLYFIFSPIATLFSWLLVGISPLLHLGHYILHALLLPLSILGRFETLYIYLSVAVLVGIITGSALYYTNVVLVSVLDLRPTPSDMTSAPNKSAVRDEIRRQKQRKISTQDPLRMSPPATSPSPSSSRPRIDLSMKREYADWLDKDRSRRRDGLLSTTILEEDDSSEDF